MMASNQTVDFIDFSKKCFSCGTTKRKFKIPLSIYERQAAVSSIGKRGKCIFFVSRVWLVKPVEP